VAKYLTVYFSRRPGGRIEVATAAEGETVDIGVITSVGQANQVGTQASSLGRRCRKCLFDLQMIRLYL
jgi:hypothetical protein